MSTTNFFPSLSTALSIKFFQEKQLLPTSTTLAFGEVIITSKSEIQKIYHHFKIGSTLSLKKNGFTNQVFFKNFYLGDLKMFDISPIELASIIERGSIIISRVERKKFFPPTSLKVQLIKG